MKHLLLILALLTGYNSIIAMEAAVSKSDERILNLLVGEGQDAAQFLLPLEVACLSCYIKDIISQEISLKAKPNDSIYLTTLSPELVKLIIPDLHLIALLQEHDSATLRHRITE